MNYVIFQHGSVKIKQLLNEFLNEQADIRELMPPSCSFYTAEICITCNAIPLIRYEPLRPMRDGITSFYKFAIEGIRTFRVAVK